ncbi:MAG: 50S ribosomal protein L13 [Bacteroidetes bacterium]|nr:50S ribosomal protein L13 [Bacteroidota bacterium]
MDSVSYKTRSISPAEIQREWVVVDATDLVLGRLASQVASIIRGKHKTFYTPNIDCGDHVIILNAEKVRLTGNKREDKMHVYHTGYPGGQRHVSARRILERTPEKLIELAVRRMLPKTKLGHQMYAKLHVYAGNEHKHQAQNPKPLELKY